MPDYGELGKGFFDRLGSMRDYQAQQEQVKFNAQLKLKEMELAERESALNEQLLNTKIEGAKQELRLGQMTAAAYDEYAKTLEPVKTEGRQGMDVTRDVNRQKLGQNIALGKLAALKNPNAMYLSPEEKRAGDVDIQGKLEGIKTEQARQGLIKAQTAGANREPGVSGTSTGYERTLEDWLDLGEMASRTPRQEKRFQQLDKKFNAQKNAKTAMTGTKWDDSVGKVIEGPFSDNYKNVRDVSAQYGTYYLAEKPDDMTKGKWEKYQKEYNRLKARFGNRPGNQTTTDLQTAITQINTRTDITDAEKIQLITAAQDSLGSR